MVEIKKIPMGKGTTKGFSVTKYGTTPMQSVVAKDVKAVHKRMPRKGKKFYPSKLHPNF